MTVLLTNNGKAIRKKVPRGSRGAWKPAPDRPDPIASIEASNQGRLKNLIPVRYERMKDSAFDFLRGTADIMAYDLGTDRPTTGIFVQVCGDCHLENFGAYATPERNVIFDITDFDETASAPWEWDVERMAVSIQVAGRVNEFSKKQNFKAVTGAVAAYRQQMQQCARMTRLEAWYLRIDATQFLSSIPRVAPDDSHELVAQEYIVRTADGVRLADKPPKLFHPPPDREVIDDAGQVFEKYRRTLRNDIRVLLDAYELVDVAVKVVGVGSVGTRCGAGLFMAGENDDLILQIKEARASVLEPYGGINKCKNNGERVVNGQLLMQSASDIFLGWSAAQDGHQFYVRQIADSKWSPDVSVMDAAQLQSFAALCGQVLAIAHSRSGTAGAIAGYLGPSDRFDRTIATFAESYADQVHEDYEAFLNALESGRLTA